MNNKKYILLIIFIVTTLMFACSPDNLNKKDGNYKYLTNDVNLKNCTEKVFLDTDLIKKIKEFTTPKDFSLRLIKINKNEANSEDYYILGGFYALGLYTHRDLLKAIQMYHAAIQQYNKKVSEENNSLRNDVYNSANLELGKLALICGINTKDISTIEYFSRAINNRESKEALYYKSILELYQLRNVALPNNEQIYNVHDFKKLVENIAYSSSEGFPLANFELYYLNYFLNGEKNSIEILKNRLFKTKFFTSCDYFQLQKNTLMPYKKEIVYRLKLIKEINPKYYQQCNNL